MNKVFVVQQPNKVIKDVYGNVIQVSPLFDISPAEEYGEIISLLPEGNAMFAPASIVSLMNKKLFNFSDYDFILPTGDPIASSIAVSIACKNNGGKCQVLKWEKRQKRYIPLKFTI